MQRWYYLLGAYNHVMADKGWSPAVRIETCKLLKRKLLELGALKPLPAEKSAKAS